MKTVNVIAINGDMSGAGVNELNKLLTELIEKMKNRVKEQGIVLDMLNVRFIDSSGIGLLSGKHLKLKKLHKRLVLCRMSDDVFQMLVHVRLHNIFEMYEDLPSAVDAMRSPDFQDLVVNLNKTNSN